MSTETRCPKCGALFCECNPKTGNVMLNKCRCGWDARRFVVGPDHQVFCGNRDCGSGVHEPTYEMAELMWNEQNPVPANPPEDFEKRFEEAIKGITRLLHDNVDDDELLPEFKANFGFDLKEVVREQWGTK